jgi:uncharacterized protein
MQPFEPLFRNPHAQTVMGHLWKRPAGEAVFPVHRWLRQTEPDAWILLESQHPASAAAGEIVLIHGLEGSGQSNYMRGVGFAALAAGYATSRFNLRACGGTERLCRTLYHAGLTSDLLAVLREYQREGRAPVWLVGFSLGGNIALKLAGELGEGAHPLIRGVCAISTPLDLAACTRRLGDVENRFYERRFLRHMRARACRTGRYTAADFAGIRSLIEADDRITAPSFGFGNAANYYRTQSAIHYLADIRIPTILIQAQDDIFVPFDIYASSAVSANPWVRLITTAHGGHLGFIGRKPYAFWMGHAVLDWIREQSAAGMPAGTRAR